MSIVRRQVRSTARATLSRVVWLAPMATLASACVADRDCTWTATCPAPETDAQAGVSLDAARIDAGGAETNTVDVVDGGAAGRDSIDASLVGDVQESGAPEVGEGDGEAGGVSAESGRDAPSEAVAEVGPSCDLESALGPACVSGVFVAPPGVTLAGTGKRSSPFRTLAQGLAAAAASTKTVFVCDDGTGYSEQMAVSATLDGLVVVGGYTCGTWVRASTVRTAVHPPSGPALLVQSLTRGLRLENFAFAAKDATVVGASSIAAIVNGSSNVVLLGVTIVAGDGGAGAAGVGGSPGDDAPNGSPQRQFGAPAACSPLYNAQVGGIWDFPTICGSKGGNGGVAYLGLTGTDGLGGTPLGLDASFNNNGGHRVAVGSPPGIAGGNGSPGADGVPGLNGAPAAVFETFSPAGAMSAPPGGNGAEGRVGQGGGGGGASTGTAMCVGASGGAGGVGGCGGAPGTGGGSGGASVALLSIGSTLSFESCDLNSSAGGAGGDGGRGGAGGRGSAGSPGGASALDESTGFQVGRGGDGGPGGKGGPGGSGAGGHGGPSYTVVYQGTAETRRVATVRYNGRAGAPGIGGLAPGGVKAPDGTRGASAPELVLPPS